MSFESIGTDVDTSRPNKHHYIYEWSVSLPAFQTSVLQSIEYQFSISITQNVLKQRLLNSWSLRRLRVSENRVLRRVFGPKKEEVTGEWRKLHNEELSDKYSLPNIVRVVKSRRMRWAGRVVRMGEGRGVYRLWWGNLRERDHLGDPDADGRIILRWIFRKWEGVVGTEWSWLRIGTGDGHLWVRWWTFGFQKCGELAAEPVSFSRRTLLHGVSK